MLITRHKASYLQCKCKKYENFNTIYIDLDMFTVPYLMRR